MQLDFSTKGTRALVEQISTPSLGDHSYLIVVDDSAAVIDPQIDIDRFRRAIERAGAKLKLVLETHVHNDYVSGGPALAKAHGAEYILPADTGAAVQHAPLADGGARPLGPWAIRAIHTPGHTPHHMSYALQSPDGAVAVFTGGSMLVAAAGRTDLIGPDWTERLTHLQYRSIHHLAGTLPEPTSVGPTHGAGSFCAAGTVTETVSTIEREKGQNPVLLAPDEDTWVKQQIASYGIYPAYYRHMGPINSVGPRPAPLEEIPELAPEALERIAEEAWLVDVRDPGDFARSHVPGSINLPLAHDAAVYIGWILPLDARLVLIANRQGDVDDLRLALRRISMNGVVGQVADGLDAWLQSNRRRGAHRVADFQEMRAERPSAILDVRDPVEVRASGHPDALNVHFSQIAERSGEIPQGEVWIFCASGYRSAIAASLLARLGRTPVAIVDNVSNLAA